MSTKLGTPGLRVGEHVSLAGYLVLATALAGCSAFTPPPAPLPTIAQTAPCVLMGSVLPQQVSPKDTERTKRDALHRNRVYEIACTDPVPTRGAP